MLENPFDDAVEEVARMPVQPLWPEAEPVPTICCVPGRNELEAAAALLLAYVLRFEGGVRRQQVFFADLPLSGAVYPRLYKQAGLVCLSLIRPSPPERARHLVQRIRRRAERAGVGRAVGIVTGRARRCEGSVWQLGRYRQELLRCRR
jgi:hypothetical protein